ncbi:MAG: CrcB family protein [Actinobacteria bacterium]|nr:CrcB family protein [Actinomycetota bacterium]MBW3649855.1 CrcB family protein [Actinomycetota bacterium]
MGGNWDRRRVTAIAVGGAGGAAVRWAVVTAVEVDGFPWPVFALNVLGSLLLGALLAGEWSHPDARVLLHDAGGIGFCGGLTTFSTFSLEVVNLSRHGNTGLAAIYGIASAAAAIAAFTAGAAAHGRVRAVMPPLEEEP